MEQTTYNQLIARLKSCVDAGDVEAMKRLGDALYQGPEKNARNIQAALPYWRMAVDRGDRSLAGRVGAALIHSDQEQDQRAGLQYLRIAAESGDIQAQYMLGTCYESGCGCQMDMNRAGQYYQMAAMENHTESQLRLGVLLLSERKEQALFWICCSYLNGDRQRASAVLTELTQREMFTRQEIQRTIQAIQQAGGVETCLAKRRHAEAPARGVGQQFQESREQSCPRCGTLNPQDARFCSICGTVLNGNGFRKQGGSAPPLPEPARQLRRKKKKRGSKGSVIVIVVLACCIVLVGGFIGMRLMGFQPEEDVFSDSSSTIFAGSTEDTASESEEDSAVPDDRANTDGQTDTEDQADSNGGPAETEEQEALNEEDAQKTTSGTDAETGEGETATGTDSEYILPNSNTQYLTRRDLAGLTAAELRLARNELYARHGRMFDSEDLDAYFRSKSWYTPIYTPEEFDAFGDSIFNEYELANRDLILEMEQALQ